MAQFLPNRILRVADFANLSKPWILTFFEDEIFELWAWDGGEQRSTAGAGDAESDRSSNTE